MAHWELELHDSRLSEIRAVNGGLEILFNRAVLHEADGALGEGPSNVWRQSVRMIIAGGKPGPKGSGSVSDGVLAVGSKSYKNVIPLPLSTREKVRLELVLAENGQTLTFSGDGIEIIREGKPELEGRLE